MPLKITIPPEEYRAEDFRKIFRQIELWANQIENQGSLAGSSLNISQLSGTGYNLPVGQVYSGGIGPVGWGGICATTGVLRVVQDGENYSQGSSATGSVGTVTVTIA